MISIDWVLDLSYLYMIIMGVLAFFGEWFHVGLYLVLAAIMGLLVVITFDADALFRLSFIVLIFLFAIRGFFIVKEKDKTP